MNWQSIWTFVNAVVLPLLWHLGVPLTLLGIAVKYTPGLFKKLDAFITEHTKNVVVQRGLLWFAHLAELVVTALEVELRPTLEKSQEDGKLTPASALALKNAAIKRLKALAGPEGIDFLHNVLGIHNEMIDAWISGMIEKAVGNLKTTQANTLAASVKAQVDQAMVDSHGAAVDMMQKMANSGIFPPAPAPKPNLATVTPLAKPEPEAPTLAEPDTAPVTPSP